MIIPAKLQAKHENHLGAKRMKAVAHSYFWWSGLDRDIKRLAKTCSTCQTHQATPLTAPLYPWVWPEAPWRRIHIDYAGPFLGKCFLSLWMSTQSGLRSSLCQLPHHITQLRH